MAVTLAGLLALAALIAVLGSLLYALKNVSNTAAEVEAEEAEPVGVGAGGRRDGGTRRRRGGLEGLRQAVEREGWGNREGGGRVKKKKEANKEAKREAREAHIARLEEMKEREMQEEQERMERDEVEERELREVAERERKIAEERERKEQEEYESWKGMISVEEMGEEGDEEEEDGELLEKFCEYIKKAKIVVLEDLAGEFSLKTEEAIDRLERLEKCGRVTGFFDDRGKFIYVSMEEMEDVAGFIRRRGRVSIADIAIASTRLLHLDK